MFGVLRLKPNCKLLTKGKNIRNEQQVMVIDPIVVLPNKSFFAFLAIFSLVDNNRYCIGLFYPLHFFCGRVFCSSILCCFYSKALSEYSQVARRGERFV